MAPKTAPAAKAEPTKEAPAAVLEAEEEEEEVHENTLTVDTVTKYQTAADIANKALAKVAAATVEGATIIELCRLGDASILEGVKSVYAKKKDLIKGIAFPTSVSPNTAVCHLSPITQDAETIPALVNGESVRIELGVHIDGYIATVANTVVVGASPTAPITGRKADALQAAYLATEAALRLLKPGHKNTEVTEAVQKIANDFLCTPVQGMISYQLQRNVMDGKKQIILNPSDEQKKQVEEITFEEGEVYSLDIMISTSPDGILKNLETHRTTIFRKNAAATYALKTETGRKTFGHVKKEFGDMAFSIRQFPEETKARLGLIEAVKHSLVQPYHVFYEKEGHDVAHIILTVLLLPTGPLKITGATWNQELVKSDKQLQDEVIKELLKQSIRTNSKSAKKKNKKKATASA